MARGDAHKRKLKAWNTKANHGRKPAKGQPKRPPRYAEILEQRREQSKSDADEELARKYKEALGLS